MLYGPSMLAEESAVAGDRRRDAGQARGVPQRRLGRGHDRFADPRLDRLDDQMRAEIQAGDDHAVGSRVPGAERQVEDTLGAGLGQAEAVADAETGAGDRLDAALGEEFVLGGI